MPAENGILGKRCTKLAQNLFAELLTKNRKSSTLIIIEKNPFFAKLFS
jgi:hypothetical protein